MSRKFQKWVNRYQDDVWSLANYLLQDASEAEDATQETFIKLWNQRETIESQPIKPWLLTVTRNACLDRLRRREPTNEGRPVEVQGPAVSVQREEMSGG